MINYYLSPRDLSACPPEHRITQQEWRDAVDMSHALVMRFATARFGVGIARRDPALLEELNSEAYCGLATALKKFRRGYATKFTTYACWWISARLQRWLKQRVRQHQRLAYSLDESLSNAPNGQSGMRRGEHLADPNAAFSEQVLNTWLVERLLLDCPDPERQVVVLRYCESRTLREIAALLGVTRSTVQTWNAHGLRHLRDRLREWGCDGLPEPPAAPAPAAGSRRRPAGVPTRAALAQLTQRLREFETTA